MMKNGIIRILPLLSGCILLSRAYGADVWDYARERSQKIDNKEMKAPARAEAAKLEKNKKPHTGLSGKKVLPSRMNKPAPRARVELNIPEPAKQSIPLPVKQNVEQFVNPQRVGEWFKKVINAIKLTPSEQTLMESYKAISGEHRELLSRYGNAQDKLKRQQSTMQLLQRSLKQAQSPALPDDVTRREVFAAGMASGYSLLEMIDKRKAAGVDLNKEDFLAGIREAMTDGKRLSKNEFELLLNNLNQKLRDAELSQLKKREHEDSDWFKNFSAQDGVIKDNNGVFFNIIYQGDRKISDDEMIYIALTRKSSSGETLFDSDTSGNYLEFNKNEIPQILSGVISKLNLHGEAVLAVYVDSNGNPDMNSHLVEQWTIRVMDAGVIAASAP